MTIQQLLQPELISYHRLFDIGPRVQSLTFTADEVKTTLLRFTDRTSDTKSDNIAKLKPIRIGFLI